MQHKILQKLNYLIQFKLRQPIAALHTVPLFNYFVLHYKRLIQKEGNQLQIPIAYSLTKINVYRNPHSNTCTCTEVHKFTMIAI